MHKPALLLAATLALAACATPETRVRTGLVRAGVAEPVAACMADRMVDRLSLGQLSKLSGLSKLQKQDAGDVSLNDFVKRTKALQDPEILSVVSSSGAICWVRSF